MANMYTLQAVSKATDKAYEDYYAGKPTGFTDSEYDKLCDLLVALQGVKGFGWFGDDDDPEELTPVITTFVEAGEFAAKDTFESYMALRDVIKYHMDRYYGDVEPQVTDNQYDLMMHRLKECEKLHPEWIDADSPSQFVAKVKASGSKVTHDVPMLSIRDVFDYDSVKEFVEEVHVPHPDAWFSVEHKIDGLSMTLRYKRAGGNTMKLVLAETRGNGTVGEDVTENAKRIAGVPLQFFTELDIDEIQVRGEVYMTHENFEKYNQEQKKRGKALAANARNLAAGTLSLKDPDEVEYRGLNLFAFNVQKCTGRDAKIFMDDHCNALAKLQSFGFEPVNMRPCLTAGQVIDAIEKIAEERSTLDYDIDGVVIKLAEVGIRDEFSGGSAKYANGHVAYKYPQEGCDVTIDAVETAVGKTGKISFTAVLHDTNTGLPAQICGTSVDRVTVNNMDYIREFKIGIGGRYKLIKSGEIIPKIVDTIEAPENVFEEPNICPCCGTALRHHVGADGKSSVDIFCDNIMCSAKTLAHLTYFVGRNQMNIEGLSEQKIDFLLSHDFINDAADFYHMANEYNSTGHVTNQYGEDLGCFDGWGKASVDNLMKAIDKSRKTTFVNFFAALSINGCGHGQLKLIAPAIVKYMREQNISHGSLADGLSDMVWNGYDFTQISGIGPVVAKALTNFVDSEICDPICRYAPPTEASALLEEVRFIDIFDDYVKEVSADSKIAGKTFVITGSVNHYTNRDALKAEIESLGGKVSGSVSKKTDFLINNDVTSTSGKNAKSKELGIPIISEEEYIAMKNM